MGGTDKNSQLFARGYRLGVICRTAFLLRMRTGIFNRCQACTFWAGGVLFYVLSGKSVLHQPKEEAFAMIVFKDMEEAQGTDEAHLLKTFILNVKSLYLDLIRNAALSWQPEEYFCRLRANPEAVMEVSCESEAERRRLGLMTMALMAKSTKRNFPIKDTSTGLE